MHFTEFLCREEDWEEHSASGTNKHNVFFLKQLEHARAIRSDCSNLSLVSANRKRNSKTVNSS